MMHLNSEILNPSEVVFDGMVIITVIINNYELVSLFGCEDESAPTLKNIEELVFKKGYPRRVFVMVIAEYPLYGTVYNYGNHGPYWAEVGKTIGFA